MRFYAPSLKHYQVNGFVQSSRPVFVAVSVTGRTCSLNCKHCGKKLLESMIPARSADRLWKVCERLHRYGARGVLVSGGVNPEGRVPLERVLTAVPRIKSAFGFKIAVHTSLVDRFQANRLASAGVDVAFTDIVGDDETVRRVYGMDVKANRFHESLMLLKEQSIKVAPHLIIGLDNGKIVGETKALEKVVEARPEALVLAVLMPLSGTPFAKLRPPPMEHVVEVLHIARSLLPDTKLLLGCAKPFGPYAEKLEAAALDLGVSGMAYPTDATLELCRQKGIEYEFSEECCGLIVMEPGPDEPGNDETGSNEAGSDAPGSPSPPASSEDQLR